jgi:class 3 adenylate cyclase/tetratricopeptide (TPR) repeat protein
MPALETISIVFTDLVGSTEMASRLGPDAAELLRQTHFSLLRAALSAHGGVEVKNLGDGLMVTFPSVRAALDGAVAMQQRIEAHNRRGGEPLAVRIGIATGDATAEDGDYFGEPVVEAARLCNAATGGQILATDVVRVHAARSGHGFTALGDLELKGIAEPVSTVEVAWAHVARPSPIPLPARLAARPWATFAGRDLEQDRIAQAIKAVEVGERRVVLISGEPGVGKTTLAAEAARTAYSEGSTVLYGRCDEEIRVPHQPFVEALGHYVAYAPEAELTAHITDHGGELARLVPALARRVTELPAPRTTDADSERYLLYGAVGHLLAAASAEAPVVLVIDDLHWADTSTLLLLRHLINFPEPLGLVVFGTYRDQEIVRGHPLAEALGAWHREARIERIELSGLGDVEIVDLMAAAAGHDLDQEGLDLAHALRRETDGNPFFTVELLRHLAESGLIYQTAGGWVASAQLANVGLPHSVRAVIGQRLARLGASAEQVLEWAAVIGSEFDLDLLSAVTQTAEDELMEQLRSAQAAALVAEVAGSPGRYRFTHVLIQHTVYEELGATRQARAHLRVAEALEEVCAGHPGARVGELARHWLTATVPSNLEKAIHYAQQAGHAALSALAPDEAVRYFSQALSLREQLPERNARLGVDLLISLGTAQRQAGLAEFRETLLRAAGQAQDLHDTSRLVGSALANNRGLSTALGQIDPEKVAVLESAMAAMPTTDSRDRALVVATLCNELTFGTEFARRRELADEARAMADRLGEPDTIVRVANLVTLPLRVPETLDELLALTGDALELARELGDPSLLFFTTTWRLDSLLHAGRMSEADACLNLIGSLSEQLGQPILRWLTRWMSAGRAMVDGNHAEAERLATEALQMGIESGQPDAVSIYGAQLMIIRWQQGRVLEILSLIAQTVADNPGIPAFAAALALAHIETDQHSEARAMLDAAAHDGFASIPLDVTWLIAMIAYAEVATQLSEPNSASMLTELLHPWSDQVGFDGATTVGSVAHSLGALAAVLGRYEEAEQYFAEATAINGRVGSAFFSARTELEWGRMLVARSAPGDLDRARELFERARATGADRGYGVVEQRAGRALAEMGT